MLISLKVAKLGLNLGIGQARMRFIAHLASCLKECARYVEIEGLLLNIDVIVFCVLDSFLLVMPRQGGTSGARLFWYPSTFRTTHLLRSHLPSFFFGPPTKTLFTLDSSCSAPSKSTLK
jgi:hypothetical protein